MANWEKLNKEFNDIFDKITDQEFQDWFDNRLNNKELRKISYQLSEMLYTRRNDFRNEIGSEILHNSIQSDYSEHKVINDENFSSMAGETSYPLAA